MKPRKRRSTKGGNKLLTMLDDMGKLCVCTLEGFCVCFVGDEEKGKDMPKLTPTLNPQQEQQQETLIKPFLNIIRENNGRNHSTSN